MVDANTNIDQQAVNDFVVVFQHIKEIMEHDCHYWRIYEITDKPEGDRQETIGIFDHEYVDQTCGISGDDYSGSMYFPVGDGRYIRVQFEC